MKTKKTKMGLRRCCIKDCKSASNAADCGDVRFHIFPSNEIVRNIWIKNCRTQNSRSLTKNVFVCSRHFNESDFKQPKSGTKTLRNGAAPTIFPWGTEQSFSEYLAEHAQDANSTLESIKEESDASALNDSTTTPTSSRKSSSKKMNVRSKANVATDSGKLRSVSADEQSTSKANTKVEDTTPRKSLDSADKTAAKENMIKSPSKKFDAAMSLIPGAKVEVQDLNGTWLNASVKEVDQSDQEVFISFDENAKSKGASAFKLNDEWIRMDSSRLRIPVEKNRSKTPGADIQFIEGERCSARWTDSRKFPATVIKVLENNTYQILFDDGFPKVVKGIHMSKVKHQADKNPQLAPVVPSVALVPAVPAIKKPLKMNPIPKFDLSKFNLPEIPADGEWCCPWINDTPIGREGFLLNADGNKRPTVLVDDSRLPTGWTKHLYQRSSTSGKWDVVLVGPNNKRFRSKNDVKEYLTEIGNVYNPDVYDFSIHKRRAKDLGVYVFTDDYVPPILPKPTSDYKTDSSLDMSLSQDFHKQEPFPGFSPNESTSSLLTRISQEIGGEASTPIKQEPIDHANQVDKGFIYVGALKVEIIENLFRCPAEGCYKNFRKENHLQMHIKHYHDEMAKKLGVCPNMTDLAYLRTIGTPGEDASPKNQIPNTQFFEKSFQTEVRKRKSMSPVHVKVEPKEEPAQASVDPQLNESLKRKGGQSNSEVKEKRKSSVTDKVISPELIKKIGSDSSIIETPTIDPSIISSTPVRKPTISADSKPVKTKPQIRFKIGNVAKIKGQRGPKRKGFKKKFGKMGKRFKRETYEMVTTSADAEDYGVTPSAPRSSFVNKMPSRSYRTKYLQYGPSKSGSGKLNADSKADSSYVNENGEVIKIVRMRQEEVINCLCPYGEEDGLMIQCELCLCWQHGGCNGIEKESDVPEKYVCYICKNPERARESMRYIHDQEWLYEGKLFHANYHQNSRHAAQRADILKQSHTLTGNLLELKRSLHSINVKINIAANKDHPKMYLWSKKWEQSPPRNSEINTSNAHVKVAPKPENKPPPPVIATVIESVDEKKEEESDKNKNDSVEPKPAQGSKENQTANDKNESTPNTDSKPAEENPIAKVDDSTSATTETKPDESSAEKDKPKEIPPPTPAQQPPAKQSRKAAQKIVHIPEPEAPIDPVECQHRLLEHIQKEQNVILSRMQTIDAQIIALESMDDHPDTNTKGDFAKTSQTIRMLLRDLMKMKKLAAINEHTVSYNSVDSTSFA